MFKRLKLLVPFVLILSLSLFPVVSNASDLVQEHSKTSYGDLPEFPTVRLVDARPRCYYVTYDNYLIFTDSDKELYYLVAFNNVGGDLYVGSDGAIRSTGSYSGYVDSNLTEIYTTWDYSSCDIFVCHSDSSDWAFDMSSGGYLLNYRFDDEILLHSTCDVYSDESCDEVFIKPTMAPTISGMSSAELTEEVLTMMIGLVPYLICLLISVVALHKVLQFLRRELTVL